MAQEDTVVDTPVSSASGSSSPPVEIVAVQPDDNDILDEGNPITLISDDDQEPDVRIDPSGNFPFRDPAHESFIDTTQRLSRFLDNRKSLFRIAFETMWVLTPTQDSQVARQISEWIKSYLAFAQAASHRTFMESYIAHRDVWNNLPDFISFMITRR